MTAELITALPRQTRQLEHTRPLLEGAFVTYGGVIALHRMVNLETVLREPDERFACGAIGYRGVRAMISGEKARGMSGFADDRFPEEMGNVLVAHRSQLLPLQTELSPQLGKQASVSVTPLELLRSFCQSSKVYDRLGGASGVTYDACISYLADSEREQLEVQFATRDGNEGHYWVAYQPQ